MKLFEICIKLPFRYGEPDRDVKEAEDKAFLASVKEGIKNIVTVPGYTDNKWIVGEQDALELLSRFGMSDTNHKEFRIEYVKTFISGDPTSCALERAAERLERAAERLEDAESAWNGHVNAPVHDGHLMRVDTLMLCEDYCTDELQGRLDDGWRIISVCPQANRRPDYILGKYTGKKSEVGALRG